MTDPFSDEADPLRLDGSRPPKVVDDTSANPHGEPEASQPPARLAFGRRPLVLALALLPVALSGSGCAHAKPACPTRPADPHHCQHRFCRYYRS